MDKTPYNGTPHVSNRSANTIWGQSCEARHERAMVVAAMPDVLERWSLSHGAERDALKSEIGCVLRGLRLLSPYTAIVDVRIDRIVNDAREYLATIAEDKQRLERLIAQTDAIGRE